MKSDDTDSKIELVDEIESAEAPEQKEIAALKAQLEEEKKKALYLRADFDNYRKQVIKERADLVKYGSEHLIREFLNVLDNLERAAQTDVTPETLAQYKEGVQLIAGQFHKTLERFGVEGVDSINQIFDPNQHEALSSESKPELPPGVVTKVFKKAYKLNGKLIRPAQVVVNTVAGKPNDEKD